jgi:hypothetical protein
MDVHPEAAIQICQYKTISNQQAPEVLFLIGTPLNILDYSIKLCINKRVRIYQHL